MLTLDKFSPSVRSGYADQGRRWRVCHDGINPDRNDSKWYVRYHKNYNGSWECREVFSGTLIECIDYVNDVAEWTD